MILLLQQFSFPTIFALLSFVSSLFPSSLPTLSHAKISNSPIVIQSGKNISVSVTPTPTEQQPQKSDQDAHSQHVGRVVNQSTPTTTPALQQNATSSTGDTSSSPSVPTAVPVASTAKTITGKSTIVASGKTIHLTFQYPSLGGVVSGTISGDCAGTISGTYAGPSTNALSGKGNATCPMGFFSIPVTITYTGVLTSSSQATISYTAEAMGKTEKGTTVLTLSQ